MMTDNGTATAVMSADGSVANHAPNKRPKKARQFICRGTPLFTRTCLALICSGFSAFAALYGLLSALPTVAHDFDLSASKTSLVMSFPTLTLAIGLIFTGPLSDELGRKPVLVGSMLAAGVVTVLTALTTDWKSFLVMRGILGLVLGGITAINMTYLTEEIEPDELGFAVGLVIGGNSLGAMMSRLMVGVMAEYGLWRETVAGLGLLTVVGAILIRFKLPASRNFAARRLSFTNAAAGYAMHFSDPVLRSLFVTGFLIMGSFVAFWNFISFHLMREPMHFSQAAVGYLSLLNIVSTITSTKVGGLTQRFGSAKVLIASLCIAILGVALCLSLSITLVILGITLFMCGFFAAHSAASGWIGRSAKRARAQATSLYQIFFYSGASAASIGGGYLWARADWLGVSLMITALLGISLLLVLRKEYRQMRPTKTVKVLSPSNTA